MPNWCMTTYAFYATTERGKKQLKSFVSKINEMLNSGGKSFLNVGLGNGWLGHLARVFCPQTLHITTNDIYCEYNGKHVPIRGCITSTEDMDIDSGLVFINTSTSTEPMTAVWRMVLKEAGYKDIKFVYRSEEPYAGLYVNTDIKHEYFPDRYYIDCAFADIMDYYCKASDAIKVVNIVLDKLKEIYTTSPEKYMLPDNYDPKVLKHQKSFPKARQLLYDNIFEAYNIGDSLYATAEMYLRKYEEGT